MDATTATPLPPLPAGRLPAHDLAVEAAAEALEPAAQVPGRLRPLADQLVRSASSMPASLAEGRGRSGRERVHHLPIAYGSPLETARHLQLLAASGPVDRGRAAEMLALLDRLPRSVAARPSPPTTSLPVRVGLLSPNLMLPGKPRCTLPSPPTPHDREWRRAPSWHRR